MRRFTKILIVGLVLLFGQSAIQAQTTAGSVTGTVLDPNGAVVQGASVTIRNDATGAERTAVASGGTFSFAALMPGIYTITVESTGFKRTVAPGIDVSPTVQTQVTIVLEIGLPDETVTVTAAQDVVNALSPSLTNVINTRSIVDLPLPTRNPLDLAALQAGIAVVGTDTRGSSVGGLRQTATNVTQDGINAMDNFVKTSSFFAISSPSLNSTGEFSITTGTTGSDQGRGVAQVNMVTKGGANQYSGGIFYMHRNDALNSNSFFNNIAGIARQRQRQHFFGFDIGGPIYFPRFGHDGDWFWNGKDRAFFFFSYEGFRENFSASRNRTVLTPEARQGIFRYNGTGGTGVQSVNLLAIGNVGVLNPITMALINSTPLPNNTTIGDGLNTAGARFNVSGSDVNDKYVFRYDHLLVKDSSAGSHKLEFVFNRADFSLNPDTFNGIEAPFPGGVNAFQESKRWLVTGALVSTFGGSVTNTFRYGKQWAPVGFLRDSNPSFPFVVFTGISNVENTFMSQGRNTTVDQYKNDLSWQTGKHLFKFGADYQKVYAFTFNDAGINQAIFLGTNAGNTTGIVQTSLPNSTTANLSAANTIYVNLVGNLASSSATFNVADATSGFVPGQTRARDFRQQDFAWYVQDQWRIRNNLTLNFGVRWDWMGVPTIPSGLAIQPQPDGIWGVSGVGNLFNPTAPAGAAPPVAFLDFVSGDTGRALYNDDWNNFAPFAGFAWSPGYSSGIGKALFGSPGRSSIRAGFSISYLRDGFTVISNAMGVGTTNPGLIQSAANTTPTGVLTLAGVPLTTPTFVMPISDRQNNLINPGNGLWAIDQNLRTPYVQQWSAGYEREIFPNTALEIRYQGNHAVKVWRANDFNEVNIFENGFLQEFINAQNNLAINAANGTPNNFGNLNPGAGTVPLPIMSAFFTGLAGTSGFGSSAFVGNLNANNVGTFANTLAFSNVYRANRENPANGIPANFFVVNPNAAFARLLTNDSMSNYHALQVELRRRFSSGLQFQADYTFSKALTDAADAQGNNQSDLVSFRTLRNKKLDYRRANFDQTHRFVANGIYELPFGRGKQFLSGSGGVVNQIVGGWTVGAIGTWSTRPPFFIVANRTTFNSFNAGLAPAQLTGMTFQQFLSNIGLFKTPGGVFFVNPAIMNISTNAAGVVTSSSLQAGLMGAPAPGEWGNFPMNSINGPRYFNLDMSVTKRFPINERVRLELKTTFINILNRTNFTIGNQVFDSTSFGRISGTSGNAFRIIHFMGSVRF
jgi:hypothetical protein